MRRFFRYDVALSATLAAVVFFALFQLAVYAAWLAAAPLVPLLRHVVRHTAPVLTPAALLLILLAGAGFVGSVEAVALREIAAAAMQLACTLGVVGGVCYAVHARLGR